MKYIKLASLLCLVILTFYTSTKAHSQVVVGVSYKQVRLNNFEVGFNNYYKGKLYFNDGTTKNGEISFPLNNLKKRVVQLLQKPDSIRVEYPLTSLNKMVYIHKGERYMMEYKKTPLYNSEIIVRVLAVGTIKLYSTLDSDGIERYLYRRTDTSELENLNLFGFIKKGFSKRKSIEFFKDCPLLVEKIENKEFKGGTVKDLVLFYNNNCE